MGYNVFQKVVKPHIVSGSMEAGKEVSIRIDQTLHKMQLEQWHICSLRLSV